MKLPDWASPDHPIARREASLWRKSLRQWAWLLMIVLVMPCGCSAVCALSGLPAALAAASNWQTTALYLGWSIFMAIFITFSLWSWTLGAFVSVASATLIARERETRNWGLLRITTVSIRDILAAKLAALGRLIAWPFIGILGFQVFGISIGVVVSLILLFTWSPLREAGLNTGLQLAAAGLILSLWLLAICYLTAASLINLVYNAAIGLVSSTLTRSAGTAVALSFVVGFGIAVFVLLPVQQVIVIAAQLIGGLLTLVTQSPVAFLAITVGVSVLLPLPLQAGITAGALYWAVNQAERIVE